jgi:hypothetical protein
LTQGIPLGNLSPDNETGIQEEGGMTVAWRTRLTRLSLVLWGVWILFILVGMPIWTVNDAREQAKSAEAESRMYDNAGNQKEAGRALARALQYKRTTLASAYKEFFAEWPAVLAFLIVPPVALYGFLYGSVLLFAWIRRGFRPGTPRPPT